MAKLNAALLSGAFRTARCLDASQAGWAIGQRGACLRRQLTAEIVTHTELIATFRAGARSSILRALGRAGHTAAFVGQADLVTATCAIERLFEAAFLELLLSAGIAAAAQPDRRPSAVFPILLPGRCRIGQRQQ
jgi:hypothetical protein